MDAYDNDIPDAAATFDIQPYQFEPLRRENNADEDSNSSNNSESDIDNHDAGADRLENTDWCDCGNCDPMPTGEECICCTDISAVNFQMMPDDLNCITEHEIFQANCLNRHVLHVSMYEYLEQVGPFDDNEPINERYRFLAYRRFVQWVWQRLGRNNRKVLPACVVKKIRDTFPSEQYCGFRYAT